MTQKERYRLIVERFRQIMPVAETELHYDNPFQLLVAVILSAQCTDKRVNMVTPALFEAYPDAAALADAEDIDVYNLIKSVSYPNNKTKSLTGMARALCERFGGEVPSTMDDLLSLPGVGRKTANVILSVIFGQAGRHPRVPRQRAHRPHHPQQKPADHRAQTYGYASVRGHCHSPSLADTSWPLCMQSPQATVR